MCKTSSYFSISGCRCLMLAGMLLAVLCFSPVVSAQQPTATITALSGKVLVSIQGKSPVAATVKTILRRGDTIQTQSGAEVVLTLSDGSELQLGENTKLDIVVLTQSTTGARTSRMKLLWGRIRAFLSSEHQQEGSAFTVETPNAQLGVKFSQPDIEVVYDPETNTTLVFAYTVDVVVTNFLTGEVKQVPQGYKGIVQEEFIKISPISQARTNYLLRTRCAVREAASPSVPTSAGAKTGGASRNLSPGVRTNRPRKPHRFCTVTVTISE